ncbi:MAG: HAD-IIIA family hydrolase [Candidatus Brocadiales bacterium]|nr:HAD-IIIA family hydrolase [Candidatus Bathyanammoxibius sp.]MCQ4574455.1 HAD-IIIA family hydrolase [Candidatus Bathyanammoxibius amoris]
MGLKDIKLLVVDVDGVLTDGRIFCSDSGEEQKVFHVRDGSGITYWHRSGLKSVIISGRASKAVEHRARELGIADVYQGATDKLEVYERMIEKHKMKDEEVCYIGDDLIDLPVLRRVGFSVAVAGSPEELLSAVDYVTVAPGGGGAVREVVEKVLKLQGKWGAVLKRYV